MAGALIYNPAMATEQIYRWEYDIKVPSAKLWRFVADTERTNQLAGIFDVQYTYIPSPTGGSEVRARAKKRGMTFEWIERPAEWVEPEFLVHTRDYSKGPLTRMIVRLELQEGANPEHTKLIQTIRVWPRNALMAMVLKFAVGVESRKGFAKVYAMAEEWAKTEDFGTLAKPTHGLSDDEQREIRKRIASISDKVNRPDDLKRLGDHLLTGSDREVATIAPYELADRWKTDRTDMLRICLHGANRGLFDMRYSILCPMCRRSKSSFEALRDVTTKGHCDACNANFGVDFDRCVEVYFTPEPIGIGAKTPTYCHAAPMNTPHRIGVWSFAPGETRTVSVPVAAGKYQLASPKSKGAVYIDIVASGQTAANVRLSVDGIAGAPQHMKAGTLTFNVKNDVPENAVLMLVRTEWADNAVTAADLTAMEEFRGLFSGEVVAPGAEFSITNMVFLFTDLVGSTAMYERIGDAPAFALVRDHFDVMRDIYVHHKGALVKTIGDAVMAVFRRSSDAVEAAFEMHENIRNVKDKRTGEPLALRIGLHRGPCIAMEANNVLDYFGTTVNVAARVQAKADGLQTAVSDAILQDSGVADIVRACNARSTRISANLKGIADAFPITLLER
ncbi:MAG: adenylate/guanylate cyclase domain-containing protein [Planctomycetes bacterium]|nr:adenylate/guanylate cyclase domain-containing protein [Planctomycetota bacterium]NUQ34301.1 adenylate/guanylate cyclase domain-containing protein [Planctomycetaceae bacterium]